MGDVVSFEHPLFPRSEVIKRVGGMPGDLVCQNGNKGEGGKMIQVRIFFLSILEDQEGL